MLTIGLALALGTATTASAEESLFTAPSRPARPIFSVPSIAQAAQGTTATTSTSIDHRFGVGIRLSGAGGIEGNGIGGSVRYFFNGGPLGIQGELSRYGVDVLNGPDWSGLQFSPAAIYRFVEQKFNSPVSLTPYAGAGLSFIHSSFEEDDDEELDFNDTNVGVLLFGGVEIFFENLPNVGVSGELTFNSNDDIEGPPDFGTRSLGGASFTVAGHWYFK
jgi:hypothetical protein